MTGPTTSCISSPVHPLSPSVLSPLSTLPLSLSLHRSLPLSVAWRRQRRPGGGTLLSVRSDRRGGGDTLHSPYQEGEQAAGAEAVARGVLPLPLCTAGRKARTSSSPSATTTSAASHGGSSGDGGFPRLQWWWWCRRRRRRPPPLHPTMVEELEKADVEGEVTASDAKEESSFRS